MRALSAFSRRLLPVVALATLVGHARTEDLGVQVPAGFEVSLYADDDLAHDIYSLTIDPRGRVVVSGAGYVRIVIDADNDGRAESAKQFAAPRTGAQGMCFYGNDLLCTADEGLIRYRDQDGDDAADGPPDVFLKLKTGGEHDSHAIHKGPDGWWYLIAGNVSGVDGRYVSTPTSPIVQPRAGVIFRLSPDLTQGEIVAQGLRNAYDFDFTATGELITFDSDEEREVSLPWYRPTRVLHVLPGSDAGWVSKSWHRPDDFFDMPPVVASFGRGSPTGVVCYRHTQFPAAYHGAIFALDWTYGRVFVLPLAPQGATFATQPMEFMTGIGEHGFAPTDAAVGPDGSLYVSVGGRGTRGGVYRIRAKDNPTPSALAQAAPVGASGKLNVCLTTPDPLSSWGRSLWEPLAAELPSEHFIRAALDERRPVTQRLRAIEILTEKHQGLDGDMLAVLSRAGSPAVRARAAWSHGRTLTQMPNAQSLAPFLRDPDPLVVRTALEALLGADPSILTQLAKPLAQALASHDRFVRQAAVRVLLRADEDTYQAVSAEAAKTGWQAGVSIASAYAQHHAGFDPYTIDVALRVLKANHPADLKLQAARLIQLALGDLGPATPATGGRRDPVFDGYATPLNLAPHAEALGPLSQELVAVYPTGNAALDKELSRVLAMLGARSDEALNDALAMLTAESDPIDDLHHLIVAARLTAPRTETQQARIADALVRLDEKIAARGLFQDSSWNDRVLEMYAAHVGLDPQLPVALLRHPQFGRSAHAQFLPPLPPEHFDEAIAVFVKAVQADPDYRWTPDVVLLLYQSSDPAVYDLIRSKFDDFGLRGTILSALAEGPQEQDRERFVTGLDSPQLDTLAECVSSLTLLPPGRTPAENVALVRTLRRLDCTGSEREIRDQVVEALRRNSGRDFGYILGRNGDRQQASVDQWTAFIQQAFPDEFNRQTNSDAAAAEQLAALLTSAPWDHGDATRGEVIYQKRACTQCHGSGKALGPDLTGVAGRFSRDDLFTAIAQPHRDVSPRYQTTLIVTSSGKTYTGVIVYESVDGLVLRDGNNKTYRIESKDIEARRRLTTSLMPSGLLKDLQPGDVADLYAYLRTLGQLTAERPKPDTSNE